MRAVDAGEAVSRRDLKVTGLIGGGHFFSHLYILVLPPLFPLLRDEYGVGFTALGFALAVLNVTTGLTQAPMGFMVDRFGARGILIAGLGVFSLAIALVGVFPTYPALIALMVVAGLGNSVFHPADYTILSASVDERRMGRAFAIHTFAGFLGFAVAPPAVVALSALFGWRAALMVLGAAGVVMALLMLASYEVLRDDVEGRRRRRAAAPRGTGGDVRLLLSAPILMSLLFFVMLSLSQGGFMSFSVSALEGLYRISLVEANVPLTAYLVLSALGVLAGGWVADRTRHHARVVAACFIIVAAATALVPQFVPPLALTAVLFGIAGFFSGLVAPARDMMVRAVTPPGASGKVFGFVTTGFNIGGVIAPLMFGLVLDFGDPRLVFWLIAVLSALTLIVVFGTGRSRRTAEPASAPH